MHAHTNLPSLEPVFYCHPGCRKYLWGEKPWYSFWWWQGDEKQLSDQLRGLESLGWFRSYTCTITASRCTQAEWGVNSLMWRVIPIRFPKTMSWNAPGPWGTFSEYAPFRFKPVAYSCQHQSELRTDQKLQTTFSTSFHVITAHLHRGLGCTCILMRQQILHVQKGKKGVGTPLAFIYFSPELN